MYHRRCDWKPLVAATQSSAICLTHRRYMFYEARSFAKKKSRMSYNLIKKPVDLKALRKDLANNFSLRSLIPYHADGGSGLKVSYEIV